MKLLKSIYFFRISFCLVFICTIILPRVVFAQQFDLTTLGQNLGKTLTDLNVKTVAVAEFASIDGAPSALGKLIAEEVTTGLFGSRNINVIERSMLEKVLHEQKFQLSGLADQKTAKKIGQLLGADALIIGTWADMGDSIRINARIVSVISGNVASAVAVSVTRTEGIKRIQAASSGTDYSGTPGFAQNLGAPVNRETAGKAGAVFFREDFTRVGLGDAPVGWGGTDNVVVKESGSKREHRVLTTFQPGPVIFRIPGVRFPENFRLRWIVSGDSECLHAPNSYIKIGNLKAGIFEHHCNDYTAFVHKSTKEINSYYITNIPKEFTIEKRGQVIRLLIDGTEELIARYPDFKVDDGFMIFLSDESEKYQIHVNLHRVEGIDLGN